MRTINSRKRVIIIILAIVIAALSLQVSAIADEIETFPDSSDTEKITERDIPSGANAVIAVIIVVVYFAILALLVLMIFIMRKQSKHKKFIFLAAVWAAVGIVFVIVSLVTVQDITYPVYVENANYDTDDFDEYVMSDNQQTVVDEYGYPTAFFILFEDELRQETWFYYEQGIIIDFLGGVEIQRGYDEELTEYDGDETDYTPDTFVFGMTPGTALDEAKVDNFLMEPLDDELVEDGVLYFAEGIVLGFIDDELYYIETLLVED